MSTASPPSTAVVAMIHWDLPDGRRQKRELHDGESLLIGTEFDADIRVDHPQVSDKHCLIWSDNGRLFLRDCYTGAGTFINGARISETEIPPSCQFRAGTCQFLLTTPGTSPAVRDRSLERLWKAPVERVEIEKHTDVDPVVKLDLGCDHNDAAQATERVDLQHQLDQANAEIKVLRERLASQRAEASATCSSDPLQEEMIEMLRAEVVELQAALSGRDADGQAAEFARQSAPAQDPDLPTREEVERVTDRLEQLLAELHERDEHILVLERLVHAAEEASQAEQEERAQLNIWVNEIEQRFRQREQEWGVQFEKLRETIAKLKSERERLEGALYADCSNAQIEGLQRLLQDQRDEISKLQSALETSKKHETQLQSEVDGKQLTSREEAVQISQERAELARLRHELQSNRRELINEQRKKGAPNELQQIREKLHELKDFVPPELGQPSLAQRLRALWKRLDG